ncbi:MAG: glycosyltransferase family 4 protein [Desulfobacula sp.]|jgi:glycosyltransferase involved in cell wall biosynthesis|nr:glycosyltransferase family 4 protein [Desulfobacula sp.]
MKKRICFVTPKFPPEYAGGSRQAYQLCSDLTDSGKSLFVITRRDGGSNSFKIKKEMYNGITIYAVYTKQKFLFFMAIAVILLKKRKSHQIVHVHGAMSHAYISIIVSKILKKKVILKLSSINDTFETIKKRKYGFIKYAILKLSDRIICLTRYLYDNSAKYIKKNKLIKIPNGVNPTIYSPVLPETKKRIRIKFGLKTDKIQIIYLGAVRKAKGLDILLKAIGEINNSEDIEFNLIIVGPYKNDLHSYDKFPNDYLNEILHSYKITHLVKFIGFVQNPQDYLKTSDIFVCPSRFEGMPNAVLEAMSCGLPCIVSDFDGAEDIVCPERNGLMFKSENYLDLAEKIKLLLTSEKLRNIFANNSLEFISKNFTNTQITKKYIALYNELLS